jgi:hypothetical protein
MIAGRGLSSTSRARVPPRLRSQSARQRFRRPLLAPIPERLAEAQLGWSDTGGDCCRSLSPGAIAAQHSANGIENSVRHPRPNADLAAYIQDKAHFLGHENRHGVKVAGWVFGVMAVTGVVDERQCWFLRRNPSRRLLKGSLSALSKITSPLFAQDDY